MLVPFEKTKHTVIRTSNPNIIFIEPFYGGSHKALIDTLKEYFKFYTLVTLPAKKWHWRARCGALCLADIIPQLLTEKVLFCSSVLSLSELLGLRNDLIKLKKVVYFHENQLVYPVREIKQRDIQYAYNQITTCLSADKVIFNSHYNRESFLSNLKCIRKIIPDLSVDNISQKIEEKSIVLYFPVYFPKEIYNKRNREVVHIVWPHRWEFDKGPDDFFNVIRRMKANAVQFKLSIVGETFTDVPEVFQIAKKELSEHILHFGFLESKEEYYSVLGSSHIVVSTAKHEFFGVSMLEATYLGCFPLVPSALVYPEIYSKDCMYKDLDELYQKLVSFCKSPNFVIEERRKLTIDFTKYDCEVLAFKYGEILNIDNAKSQKSVNVEPLNISKT